MANFVKNKPRTKSLNAQMQFLAVTRAANINQFDVDHPDWDFAFSEMEKKGWLNHGFTLNPKTRGLALGLEFLNLSDQAMVLNNTIALFVELIRTGKFTGELVEDMQYMCQLLADARPDVAVTEELIEPAIVAEVEVEVVKSVETKAKKSKKVAA